MEDLNSLGQKFAHALMQAKTTTRTKRAELEKADKVHVVGAGSMVTAAYEQLRNAAEYSEEHLLLQKAIRRFYRRWFLTRSLDSVAKSGGELITELTFAGYIANDSVAETTLEDINRLAREYHTVYVQIQSAKNVPNIRAEAWAIDVLSVEVSRLLVDTLTKEAFAQFAFDHFKQTTDFEQMFHGVIPVDLEPALYVAINKALLKFDTAMIRASLLRRYNQSSQDFAGYCRVNAEINMLFESDTVEKLSRFVDRQGAPLRIIFSWFLKEKKSAAGVPIVPSELLSLDAVASNADYYHSILEPLFFELLNKRIEQRDENLRKAPFSTVPYLNGGLFSPQHDDYYNQNSFNGAGTPGLTHIPDSWFTELFTILEQYNFTVDENTSYDVDLSIDPEMLGRIFENLLAEINPETGESARKSTGSFYTPREIVEYMVDSSLLEFLKSKTSADEDKLKALISWGQEDDKEHELTADEKQKIVNALAGLTILDPACGSGAFPIGVLQKVVYILQQADPRAEVWLENQLKNISSPELKRDIQEKYESENYDWLRKYGVIRETIFGVDIQTIATEISKLRCFLTLIIEEEVDDNKPNRGVHALPNLDFKFVTANSLIGLPDSNANAKSKGLNLFEDVSHIEQLKNIRNQYFGANADERARLQVEFKNLQMDMLRSRIATSGATSDLYNTLSDWDPFSHKATEWFDADWMFGLEGFDIVIANPPYVGERSHKKTFDKLKSTNLGGRFYLGKMDLYYFFFHLALDVCKPYGSVTFITTNSYFRSLGGKKLRDDISSRSYIQELVDFNGIKIFDTADNYTVITKLKKKNIVDAPRDVQCRVVVANHNGSVDSTTLQSIINGADRESEYSLRNQATLFIGDDLQIETLSNTEMSSIYEKISSHNKISHNFKVSAGVQTGADKVTAQHKKLLGDRVKQGDGILVLKLTEIESLISKGSQIPNYFKPWYLNPDVGRWSPSVITSHRVAYFDRSFLERNIDDAYLDYLKRFQPVLNKRREVANNVIEWWQLQWPRSSSIFTEPKVICCKWSARNDFAYTDLEWYSSVNVTYISNMKFSDTAYLKYLTGVLNSKLYYLWFYNKSKRAGNRLLLDPKPVMETPLMIPKSIDTVNTVANLVDEIIKLKATKPIVDTSALESQIDQLVYQLYDLTPEEIAIVEAGA